MGSPCSYVEERGPREKEKTPNSAKEERTSRKYRAAQKKV